MKKKLEYTVEEAERLVKKRRGDFVDSGMEIEDKYYFYINSKNIYKKVNNKYIKIKNENKY